MSQVSEIQNIQGPITFRYLTNGTQNIYLFGDKHVRSAKECPDSQHIVDVLKSVTQPYDFYVEGAPEHAHEDIELTNYLREVLKLVHSNNVINVKYSDVRHIHFDYYLKGITSVINLLSNCSKDYANGVMDNTLLNSYINQIVNSLEIYYKYQEETNNFINVPNWTFNKMGIVDDFKNFSNSSTENANKADFLLNGFFNKLRNLEYDQKFIDNFDEIMNTLGPLFFFRNKRGEIKPRKPSEEIAVRFMFLMKPKQNGSLDVHNKYDQMSLKIIHIGGLYMDIYLLLNFLKNNNTNNVIYAGEWHIINYTRFFNAIGFETKYAKADIGQCVPIGDNKLPLFS
jgi:hypothetical protein